MPVDLTFPPLLTWLSEVMHRNEETEFALDDLRKISTNIAQGLSKSEKEVLTFMDGIVDKFGYSKVREFMEI
jgi:hypothetical protein